MIVFVVLLLSRSCSSGEEGSRMEVTARKIEGDLPARPPAEGAADAARRARGGGPRGLGREAAPLHEVREGPEPGAEERPLPARLRPRVLRHRDDHCDRPPAHDLSRFGAEVIRFSPRQGDLLILSGRVSIRWRGSPPARPPDARAEVGDRDGRLLVERRHVQQLRRRPGRRQVPARGRLRAGLSAAPEGPIYGIKKLQDKITGDPAWAGGSGTKPREPRKRPDGVDVPDATGLELIAQRVRERSGRTP